MTVNLASRISALLLAGTIVAAGWAPVLHAPHAARHNASGAAARS